MTALQLTRSTTTATETRSLRTIVTTPVILSVVRVVFSFLWICHGLQGLVGYFGGIDGHGM
ncbi:MAG TPA: DoxX family protein, partial [Pseudonocardiaceae bacterium]